MFLTISISGLSLSEKRPRAGLRKRKSYAIVSGPCPAKNDSRSPRPAPPAPCAPALVWALQVSPIDSSICVARIARRYGRLSSAEPCRARKPYRVILRLPATDGPQERPAAVRLSRHRDAPSAARRPAGAAGRASDRPTPAASPAARV